MRICFYRFLHVILHEGRSCPELQNPLYQKAKENLLPGEKVPIRADEGWGKVLFQGLTQRLRRFPLSLRARIILEMMDSATPPSGGAQNDSMVGGVMVSYQNEGRVQSCSCGADYLDCR